ncbi:MAG: hypothetical protein KDA61_14465 [Planctomycetales bacterium]|nr:hypothetical protein [Planctomycetales bacterium]
MDLDTNMGLVGLLADMPTMDAKYLVGIVSRTFHITGALMLGGSFFYLKSVLGPAGADACFADRRKVFARWVHVAITLLLASGIYNFIAISGAAKASGSPLPAAYHALFGIKFLVGLLLMFVASLVSGRSSAAERARTNIEKWLGIGWSATLAIVVLGAILRSLH